MVENHPFSFMFTSFLQSSRRRKSEWKWRFFFCFFFVMLHRHIPHFKLQKFSVITHYTLLFLPTLCVETASLLAVLWKWAPARPPSQRESFSSALLLPFAEASSGARIHSALNWFPPRQAPSSKTIHHSRDAGAPCEGGSDAEQSGLNFPNSSKHHFLGAQTLMQEI